MVSERDNLISPLTVKANDLIGDELRLSVVERNCDDRDLLIECVALDDELEPDFSFELSLWLVTEYDLPVLSVLKGEWELRSFVDDEFATDKFTRAEWSERDPTLNAVTLKALHLRFYFSEIDPADHEIGLSEMGDFNITRLILTRTENIKIELPGFHRDAV